MSVNHLKHSVPFVLGGLVFAAYLITIVPVVYVGDSGELTAAAFSLGLPHPSGFPLYCLVGKIFCMIPLGNIGFKLNLMSALFSTLTVCIVYAIILKFTSSVISSFIAAAIFAFIPLLWFQAGSAEVYPLHSFFVAAMIRLLLWWDETKEFRRLLAFVFITGLSFGNHMQTVMLALPVLYLVISGDRKALLCLTNLMALFLCLSSALLLYLYLPIRTEAGAAIHWGDPNTFERFFAHFTTKSYRQSYVFGAATSEYLLRAIKALTILVTQYGILLLPAVWGWFRLNSSRWRIFFIAIVFFDLFYSVFLNLISFEITPFGLPTCIVVAILLGVGMNDVFRWIARSRRIGSGARKGMVMAASAVPIISFVVNFDLCDQSRNYTALEQSINTFRTAECGETVFVDGDNNLFPVTYGRIAEGMGNGVALYDRQNIIFKWSQLRHTLDPDRDTDGFESVVDRTVQSEGETSGVYFLVFNPHSITMPPNFRLVPYGILRKAVQENWRYGDDMGSRIWDYYSDESFQDHFARDYMTREVCSFFFFKRGETLWASGRMEDALHQMRIASLIGYNDTSIHSEIGIFLAERSLFEEAKNELEKALLYTDDVSGINNNWGYYYHKRGDYGNAIASFEKAIESGPFNYSYYNNLALTLFEAGKKDQARLAFKKSLELKDDQPDIRAFTETNNLE